MTIKSRNTVQLFDSVWIYVFMFCILALIAAAQVHQLTKGSFPASTNSFEINNLVLALITIYIAVYLAGLLRKLSSRIEQAAVVLFEVLCILWFAEMLAKLGIVWAKIPNGFYLTATLNCTLTVFAGIRAFQMLRHKRLAKGT
jgi:hypothetical protein